MAKEGGAAADVSEKYVKWLPELSAKSGAVAGGKGANLAEMYNIGLPVPPAFVVTAQAFDEYLKSAGLKEKIKRLIDETNVENTEELEKNARHIRELVSGAGMPKEMQREILEAYKILWAPAAGANPLDVLKSDKEPVFVAVRSSATTEDLSTASFAGQQETFTNIKGESNLLDAVKKCFASLYTARAVYYRHKKGFEKANALLAVVVQRMINSEKSGVIFTRNPVSQKNEIIVEAVFGLGEGIVSGKIAPDKYVVSKNLHLTDTRISKKKIEIIRTADGVEKIAELKEQKANQQVLSSAEIISLANLAVKIEQHYKKPQDIEFAVEKDKIYIVQSRPITTFESKGDVGEIRGSVLLTGLGASPGVASGRVRIIADMADLNKIQTGDILVTKMTNPDMVVTMQKSSAIVTDEGGITAHAAIVSREMGIACVVGTEKATKVLKDGMLITVDGTNGKVHEGAGKEAVGAPVKKEILPAVKGTHTKIKVMVDLPDFAERAAKSGCGSVGLLRLEGIIASSGKHPLYFVKQNNTHEYSKIIEKGISEIATHFKEVWVRTSDIRTDEYQHLLGAPKEIELNPMLGFHGIRFSLKHRGVLDAELSAIKRVAERYPEKKFGIMFPQIISEREMEQAFKIFHDSYMRNNIIIGAMIETPAAVQVIRGICKYAKFISFGTNDLTQYTLAIDRGNSEVQYLYDEMHPAVLAQIKKVLDACREYKIESSICGQAGSKPEMVEFLVRNGINSISVNADMAHEISKYVLQLEGLKRGQNTNNQQNNNQNNMAKKNQANQQQKAHEESAEEIIEEVEEEEKKKEQVQEKAAEEFPDIEIGFDVFKAQ